jgi:tetratricopeptide (TPR) repeat protein
MNVDQGNIEHRTSNAERRMTGAVIGRSMFDIRLFLLVAALWLGLGRAFAADVSAEFDAANKLYEQGKFSEAAAAYEKLIQSGTIAPTLYFNLGNAFFKAGERGRAIAAYRQAEQLSPRDPEVRANLQFARNQIQGPSHRPARWELWFERLTVNEWTVLAAIALWVWLSLLALTQLRRTWRPLLRSWIWLAGAATLLAAGGLGAVLTERSHPNAVVIARDATIHNGPLDESPGTATVHDGAELKILDRKNDWLQVSAGDRRTGWLKQDYVHLLPL